MSSKAKILPSDLESFDRLPHREFYDKSGELGINLPNIEGVYHNVINNLFKMSSKGVELRNSDIDRLKFEFKFLEDEIPWLNRKIDEAEIVHRSNHGQSYELFDSEYARIIEFLQRKRSKAKKELVRLNVKKVAGKSIQTVYELNLTHQILIIEYLQRIDRFIKPNSSSDNITQTSYYELIAVLLNTSPEQVKKKAGKFEHVCLDSIDKMTNSTLNQIQDDLIAIRPAFIGIEQILSEIDDRISMINQKLGKLG